jgi:hypothetical protein
VGGSAQGKAFVPQQEWSGFWLAKGQTSVEVNGARVSKPVVLLALEKAARGHVTHRNRSFCIMRPNNCVASSKDYMELSRACVARAPASSLSPCRAR